MNKKSNKKRKEGGDRPMGLKKSKKPIIPNVFSEGLLGDESRRRLQHEQKTNGPYNHVVIDNFCMENVMREVHEEAKHNFNVDYKETDLFKVYQSGELANMDASSTGVSHLVALRSALYSAEFRDFIGQVMGCDDLTDRVDCSANAYTQGCHLLCHDDVIGTRRISYIIYLTDPDDPWLPEYGGSLELYPLNTVDQGSASSTSKQTSRLPASTPTKTIIPRFNRIAAFRVQPGMSYHSVQEVFADRPRLSISGWFHGPSPPEGAEASSLQQLLASQAQGKPFIPLSLSPPLAAASTGLASLSSAERGLLQEWINPVYLTDESIQKVRRRFCKHSYIQLVDFLHEKKVKGVKERMLCDDKLDKLAQGSPALDYEAGTHTTSSSSSSSSSSNGRPCQVVGPPHMRRHIRYDTTKSCSGCGVEMSMADMLTTVFHLLMDTPAFAYFLQQLTAVSPARRRGDVRRFRPGLDYTVAHRARASGGDAASAVKFLDATLCFVATREPGESRGAHEPAIPDMDDADMWESGDVGGFECYIEQDEEDAEAAEVYAKDKGDDTEAEGGGEKDDDVLLSVQPGQNVLSLVMRDEQTLRFVKYVSARAPSSRWDVSMDFELAPMDDDDDDDDDSDDSDDSDNEDEDEEEETEE